MMNIHRKRLIALINRVVKALTKFRDWVGYEKDPYAFLDEHTIKKDPRFELGSLFCHPNGRIYRYVKKV